MRLATRVLFTWTRPPKRGHTGALAGATYIHNMEAKGVNVIKYRSLSFIANEITKKIK